MFTGLVEEIGVVESIKKGLESATITLKADKVLKDVRIGDSISTNGVCLTVVRFDNNTFTVDVMPETMSSTNLKYLTTNSKVNLERALKVGDRLGGHFVSGHIDGVGVIKNFKEEENATWVSIKPPPNLMKYIIHKGSITIDGSSLTVSYVDDEVFKVSIIPLTRDETTLLSKAVGDKVNLECDMIGKYILKFMKFEKENSNKKSVDLDFLRENGFL